jgi:hypothetical protein
MFDNSKPNIILLTDITDPIMLSKLFGVSKVACELRNAGFEVAVINHLHIFSIDELKHMLSQMVNENTLFVGTSPFVYKNISLQVDLDFTHNKGGVGYGPKEWGSFLPHGLHYNSEIKSLVNGINPNCKFVLGGPDAQDREYARDYDYVVIGYADNSIIDLARHLEQNTPLSNSRKSLFGPVIVDDREAIGYDFANSVMRYESHDVIIPGETLMTEIARGCIFQCGFCSYPLNGKKKLDFVKNEEVLYAEFMDNYNRWGVTRYVFVDDTYNDSEQKVEMMHRLSKRLPFELEYWASMRVDLLAAHPHHIDLLYESGCRGYMFGVETLNEETGKIIGKGSNRERVVNAINTIKERYGNKVMLHGSFIFGLPKESITSMRETANRCISGDIKLDSYVFHAFRLMHPGNSYTSKFDKDPDKYGYRLLGDVKAGNRLVWENDYTNYFECEELTKEFMELSAYKTMSNKINGSSTFWFAGMGFDMEFTANKNVSEINWQAVEIRKKQLARRYKNQLYKELQISPVPVKITTSTKDNLQLIGQIRELDLMVKP